MLEHIAAAAIWGLLTAGVAWVALLAARAFFRIRLDLWTKIYDPLNPNEAPIPPRVFSRDVFFSRFFGMPLLILFMLLAFAVILLVAGLFLALFKCML